KGVSFQGYAGQYFWAYESDHVSADQLKHELDELSAKTGLKAVRSFRMPTDGHLGYLNIKFSAELSQQATDALMAWATVSPLTLAGTLGDAGVAAVESYFSSRMVDPDHLCVVKAGEAPQKTLDPATCKAQLVLKTKAANSEMVRELRAMAQAKNKDLKEF